LYAVGLLFTQQKPTPQLLLLLLLLAAASLADLRSLLLYSITTINTHHLFCSNVTA
jgi:hypothetical protein